MSNHHYLDASATTPEMEEDASSADLHFTSASVDDPTPNVGFKYALWGGRQRGRVCRQFSTREMVLLIAVAVAGVAVLVLAGLLAGKQKQIDALQNQQPCTTPACVSLAATMMSAMDQTVSPCHDFYEYACGGWRRGHVIPPGNSEWGTFDKLAETNLQVVKNILENRSDASASVAMQKARSYYTSCMDPNKTIEGLGAKPLYDLLTEVGGWSVSTPPGRSPWQLVTFDLQATLTSVTSYAVEPFFSLYVMEDEKNVSVNILQVDQSGLSLPREEYINKTVEDKVYGAYFRYMVDIGVLLGGDTNATSRLMQDVLEFEAELAQLTTPDAERRDAEKLYHKMSLAKLQQLAPFIDWQRHLGSLFGVYTNYTLSASESVLVYAPEFLGQLSTVVGNMTATQQGNTTLHNYMVWHLIKAFASAASEPFRDAAKTFSKTVNGIEGDLERWKSCVTDTSDVFGFAVGALYVQQTFHGQDKAKAEQMIGAVKRAFKDNLPRLSWMDDVTRRAAEVKVDAVIDMIGYPDYILNRTALDSKYDGLEVSASEYFANNVRRVQFSLQHSLQDLRKAPDKTIWQMKPQEVNAYYSPTGNEIVFPAGILQPPFFDQEFPMSVNFGGMGVVMGHELTHGFDDQGREFDADGTLRMWWQNSTIERFNLQAQCFVEQYSKYRAVGEENINGLQTLGENIADNGGLTAAFHAYRKLAAREPEAPRLPGLDLSHDQLFFLAFSQVWCSVSTPEELHNNLLSDPHSPGKYRVIGTLSNSRDFAETFQCAADASMNPKNKCVIW